MRAGYRVVPSCRRLLRAERRTDVTLSVRTTRGHVPPEPVEKDPAITVSHTGVDGNGYHVASFTCHSCAAWAGNAVEIDSPAMPWLWASDYFGTAQTNDVGWSMTKHEAYGQLRGFWQDVDRGG